MQALGGGAVPYERGTSVPRKTFRTKCCVCESRFFPDVVVGTSDCEAPHPEYSRANFCPWSPFPRAGPVQDPKCTSTQRLEEVEIEYIGKSSQERRTRGTVSSAMRRAAHRSDCARCGAGAGCSAMKHQSLRGPATWPHQDPLAARRDFLNTPEANHVSK